MTRHTIGPDPFFVQMMIRMASKTLWTVPMAATGQFDVVLDIGSHVGWTSAMFKILNPKAKVVSFEPCLVTHKMLSDNLNGSGIEIHRLALSNIKKGTMCFAEPSVSNKFVSADGNGDDSCEGMMLDEIVNTYAKNCPTGKLLIKMNCEGGELSVFNHKPSAVALASAAVSIVECHNRKIINRFRDMFADLMAKTHEYVRVDGKRSSKCDFVIVSNLLLESLMSNKLSEPVLREMGFGNKNNGDLNFRP